MTTRGPVVILDPPEPDSHLVLVDVPGAKDADAAVASAWAAYRPGAKRPLKLAVPQAAHNGWDERRTYSVRNVAERAGDGVRRSEAGGDAVGGGHRGRQRPDVREARRTVLPRDQQPAPKGYRRETFAGKKAHPLDEKRVAEMKEFVARGMALLGVPGVGFSLIDGGKVVFEGGLGVRELGKPETVDADTLFIAASNTKAMTTLLLAELVDEKKLRWDQPVIGDLPGLQARRRRHDEAGAGEAPRLRLHRPAAPGPGVALRVQGRHADVGDEAPRHDAADEPLRRGLPVQQPHGVGGRIRRGVGRLPGARPRRRVRRRDADEDLRAARHDAHDLRLRARPEGELRSRMRRTST